MNCHSLNDPLVYSVAKLAKAKEMGQFHALFFVSLFFLRRVQSEVPPLQMGEVAGFVGKLPVNVHSAVLVQIAGENKTLHIR